MVDVQLVSHNSGKSDELIDSVSGFPLTSAGVLGSEPHTSPDSQGRAHPLYPLGRYVRFNGVHLGLRSGWQKSSNSRGFLLTCLALSKIICAWARRKTHTHRRLAVLGEGHEQTFDASEKTKIASKGGKARAEKLSAAERRRIAKKAVAARERKEKEGRKES